MKCKCGCMMTWYSDYFVGRFISWYTCPVCGYDTRNEQITLSDHTEPCEDAISRQAVIDTIDEWVRNKHILETLPVSEVTPLFENIHKLPPVTPQQDTASFDFELYQAGLMDMPKEFIEVLEKIRSEIKDTAFDWQEIDGEHESFMVVNLNDALQIIDKYRKRG